MSHWTPITPKNGGLVHMTSLTDPHKTQCKKICSGWVVALGKVTCDQCKASAKLPRDRGGA